MEQLSKCTLYFRMTAKHLSQGGQLKKDSRWRQSFKNPANSNSQMTK